MDYPKSDAGARLQNGKFTDGDPVNNIPPSKDSAVYQNMVFDELINAITEGGATPDETKSDQLAGIIRQLKSGGRILGEPFWHLGDTPPTGALFFAGQLLSRSDYPELWAALNTPERNINLITDTEWLAGRRGFWSTGNNATTFRAPDPRALALRVWDNGAGIDSGRISGDYQEDAIRNIQGSIWDSHGQAAMDGDGVFSGNGNASSWRSALSNSSTLHAQVLFDASRVVPTANENRMKNIAWPLSFWYE